MTIQCFIAAKARPLAPNVQSIIDYFTESDLQFAMIMAQGLKLWRESTDDNMLQDLKAWKD